MRNILTLAAVTMALPLLLTGTPAAASCSDKDVNIDGSFGGESFSTPARLDFGEGDNIGLSAEDCDTNTDNSEEARRDGRRAASIAASMDSVLIGDGLNLRFTGANTGLGNDDTYAIGTMVGYQHTFAQPLGGVIHGIAGDAGFAADTTGSDYGAKVGLTINFGTF